ncbi:hypothetical protein MM300_12605 [Evansella sp. LMS18]|jgi:hypothetical protein|uniref:hypothetical protein n=1 Tax=Evansella sp. LMS18 TaxID=2924033 RepID=UPI0020D14568|nr:hypothetical protein [Evansella sp. LMS18]UTR08779.1 hypothetical protein MM300_12605 [Evansella sp. LMS18]
MNERAFMRMVEKTKAYQFRNRSYPKALALFFMSMSLAQYNYIILDITEMLMSQEQRGSLGKAKTVPIK